MREGARQGNFVEPHIRVLSLTFKFRSVDRRQKESAAHMRVAWYHGPPVLYHEPVELGKELPGLRAVAVEAVGWYPRSIQ